MPLIKLIKVYRNTKECYNCDTELDSTIVGNSLSPWQEVTDKELEFLRSWQAQNKLQKDGIIIVEDITSETVLSDYIKDIKRFIADEERKQKEREKKYKEAEKKRKQTAELRKLEKARKLLEQNGLKVE